MTLSQLHRGTRVRVPWGAATMGKSHSQGDGYVHGTVTDAQVLSRGQAVVTLTVTVPGERVARDLTLHASGGTAAEFDLLPA